MATKQQTEKNVKRSDEQDAMEAGAVARDQLESLARQGAREMLMTALDEEVEAYLGRGRYAGSAVAEHDQPDDAEVQG